jgi:putative transposase
MATQREFVFRTWGGKRARAGRKPRGSRAGVPHRVRAKHRAAHPVHVTLRARAGLPPFRERVVLAEMRGAIAGANRSRAVGEAFRVVEFSVQNDHVHLIVEASNRDVLIRGVQGLSIRLARAVNRALSARGPVWGDRYHARDLRTPREVRNAIVYVLMNAKKHGSRIATGIDTFSSAPWFGGFAVRIDASPDSCPVFTARTWLGGTGWRRRGLVRFDERPGAPG